MRRLYTRELLLTLLFAKVSDARSLRDIAAIIQSQDARRYHAGLQQVKRSTLEDGAASRLAAVFTGLLSTLIGKASRKLRLGVGECVRLIDSTTLPLNRLGGDWARFSAELCCGS